MILSYTLILPMSQLETQQQTYNILVLILY